MNTPRLFSLLLLLVLISNMMLCAAERQAEATPGKVEAAGSSVSTENRHHQEEGGMFEIDPKIFVAQTVNFFLLLWLLNRFLYAPLAHMVEQRRAHIATDLDLAHKTRLEAEAVRAEWEKKIETVEQETYRMRQQAIGEANAAREQIVAEAKAAAAAQRQAAERDILIAKQKAWVELREEVVQLSLAVAEKVIEKSLDDQTHRELIKSTIAQLEKIS